MGDCLVITIIRFAPRLFNTHGDVENSRVLAHRARQYGVAAEEVDWEGEPWSRPRPAVVVVGSPMELQWPEALARLQAAWAVIATWQREGTVVFCAGNSIEMLGQDSGDVGPSGTGLGVVDVRSTGLPSHQSRFVEVTHPAGTLTGFINRDRAVVVGADHAPGIVTAPADCAGSHDLVITPTLVATALRWPVLATNPWLADHILAQAGVAIPDVLPSSLAALDEHARQVADRIRGSLQ